MHWQPPSSDLLARLPSTIFKKIFLVHNKLNTWCSCDRCLSISIRKLIFSFDLVQIINYIDGTSRCTEGSM